MSTQWERMLQEIVSEYKENPDNFLRQRQISRAVHPNQPKLAENYYNDMMKSSFFRETILPKMRDSSVGNPYKFKLLPECSTATIVHTHYLHVIKEQLDIFVPTDKIEHIVEIGGGYGNLCRLVKSYGYEGKYTIVDFPQMQEIQNNFLSRNSIHDVQFSDLDMENLKPSETSMLIATFSVNEMPIETRTYMEPYYENYDYLFFAYNPTFDGVDNVKYFEALHSMLENKFKIKHIKDKFRQTKYMLCTKERM